MTKNKTQQTTKQKKKEKTEWNSFEWCSCIRAESWNLFKRNQEKTEKTKITKKKRYNNGKSVCFV